MTPDEIKELDSHLIPKSEFKKITIEEDSEEDDWLVRDYQKSEKNYIYSLILCIAIYIMFLSMDHQ